MSKDNSITTRGSRVNKVTSVIMAFVLAFGLCPTPGKAYAADPAPSEESANLTAATADLQAADDGASMVAQDGAGTLTNTWLSYYPYYVKTTYDEVAGSTNIEEQEQIIADTANGQYGAILNAGSTSSGVPFTNSVLKGVQYYTSEEDVDGDTMYKFLEGNPNNRYFSRPSQLGSYPIASRILTMAT